MLRRPASLTEQIADIIRADEERKTSQFTSQDSGMKFKQIETVSDYIQFVASTSYAGEVQLITNYFVPAHGGPAICVPHFELETTGYKIQETRDYKTNYSNIMIYDQSDTMLGYIDIWKFYHRRGTTDGSYGWQTVAYTWANSVFNFKFNISLRATDSGTHTVRVERSQLG